MEVADRRLHTTKKGGLNRRRVKEVVVKIWGSLDGLVRISLRNCIEICLFEFDRRSFYGHTSLILLYMHMLCLGLGSAHWTLKYGWSNCVHATYA